MGSERLVPSDIHSHEEYLLYLKEVLMYEWAAKKASAESACLDLGCGSGYGTKILSSVSGNTVGVDVSHEAIAEAKKIAGEDLSFVHYNGKRLPFADDSFDIVTSFHVIEHVIDDADFTAEIHRVLKNNGIAIISTPNRAIRVDDNKAPWNIFHVREYTPLELEALLQRSFREVTMLGLDASADLRVLEEKRIARKRKIAAYDIFNLRRIIPVNMMSYLLETGRAIAQKRKGHDDEARKFSGEKPDQLYFVEPISDKKPLDVVAVAVK